MPGDEEDIGYSGRAEAAQNGRSEQKTFSFRLYNAKEVNRQKKEETLRLREKKDKKLK